MKNLKKAPPFSIKPRRGVFLHIGRAYFDNTTETQLDHFNMLNHYSSSMYVADWMPFSATVTLYIFTVSGSEGAI